MHRGGVNSFSKNIEKQFKLLRQQTPDKSQLLNAKVTLVLPKLDAGEFCVVVGYCVSYIAHNFSSDMTLTIAAAIVPVAVVVE